MTNPKTPPPTLEEFRARAANSGLPLTASLSLAARGKTEEILGKIGALDGTRDDLGYAKTREPVALTGTLGRPDPMPYFTKVAISKLLESSSPPPATFSI